MSPLSSLSNAELLERLPALVGTERHAMVDVIEHLVEVERRRLYLSESCSCLYRYCIDRLGYSEDAALNRHRVTQLALRLPQVLDELRAGTVHLTGLFLLSNHLNPTNAAELLGEARGKSRRDLEKVIARWFPRSDVPPMIEPLSSEVARQAGAAQLVLGTLPLAQAAPATCIGTGSPVHARVEPLSPTRLRVEFSARAALYEKIEKARELLSHSLPSGDLGELFERALDALIEQESRKRFGAGKPRKKRALKAGSRHVPVDVQRAVWERDGSQCAFVDSEGRRCAERRFLTLEHVTPFALGGPPTLDNLCLLCRAHNVESARRVFGAAYIEAKVRERATGRAVATGPQSDSQQPLEMSEKVLSSLCGLGFARSEASMAVGHALGSEPGLHAEQLLRKCLLLLVRKAS